MRSVQTRKCSGVELDTKRVVDSVLREFLPLRRCDFSVYESGLDISVTQVIFDEVNVFA
jgi:hypothetical protein